MCYTYLPAFNKFGKDAKIVHFLGNQKPWMFNYNKTDDTVDAPDFSPALVNFLKMWWRIFTENVSNTESGRNIAEQLEALTLAPRQANVCSPTNFTQFVKKDRLFEWEQGRIDYLGEDSYENIQKKLDETINTKK
ncbi:glycogenin-1 [Caerostris extrusa]|uniref:Glycogenin-1 n=1 Tax=Caerostris extrusa TaxID=172846 RepID=A0AAV4VCW0_CAEEX|nr:glycogenin-1 [Caerostris extrusa]